MGDYFMSKMELILEFEVSPKSPIVGKTVREVQEKYKVRILHIHKGISEKMIRYNPPPNRKIEPHYYLKVTGEYDKVANFGYVASRQK